VKGAFLLGLINGHGEGKEEEEEGKGEGEEQEGREAKEEREGREAEGRRGLVIFRHGEDGKWRRDGVVIEEGKEGGYKVTIEWNRKGEIGRDGSKEAEEAGEGMEGREGTEREHLTCVAPHLYVLLPLLRTLYGGRTPKFTSLNGDSTGSFKF
jgi:hypothetical protein